MVTKGFATDLSGQDTGVSKKLKISSPQGQLAPKGKGPHVVILTTYHALKLLGSLCGHTDLE